MKNRYHQSIAFALSVVMTVNLLCSGAYAAAPSSSDDVVTASDGAEAAATNASDDTLETAAVSDVKSITGFVPLSDTVKSQTYSGKPTESDILAALPTTLSVYLDDNSEPTSIAVGWYCMGEYTSTDDYCYQFSPAWDAGQYTLSSSLNETIDMPYIDISLTSNTLGTSAVSSASRNSTEQKIYNYLISTVGLNTAAAAGLLANVYYECGFDYTQTGDKGTSYGIVQWHDGKDCNRWTELKTFCKKNGYDWETLDGQLAFLSYDLDNSYAALKKQLLEVSNDATGAYDAAHAFCSIFEVPSNTREGVELFAKARGKKAYDTYWNRYGILVSELTVSADTNTPESLIEGKSFSIYGTIHSPSIMTEVTVGCYNEDGDMVIGTIVPLNVPNFDIHSVDRELTFGALSAGTYSYRIIVTNDEGTTTVVNSPFTVSSSQKPVNVITAADITKTSSTEPQTFALGAVTNGGAVLSYTSDTDAVTVAADGNVTIAADFSGTAVITINAAESTSYASAVKQVTITVTPAAPEYPVPTLKTVYNQKGGRIKAVWTPVEGVRGYQIQCSETADFASPRMRTAKGAEQSMRKFYHCTIGQTYYLRIRTYIKQNEMLYYSDWSDSVTVTVKK